MYYDEHGMIEAISEWIVRVGTQETRSAHWVTYSDEITDAFSFDNKFIFENREKINKSISRRKEVADSVVNVDSDNIVSFDVVFYLDFCKNLE